MPKAPFDPDAEFYGTETTFHPDGTKTVAYRGGYTPRPMTESELRPWVKLAKSLLQATEIPACTAA